GTIGLLVAQTARASGAAEGVITDVSEPRLELARRRASIRRYRQGLRGGGVLERPPEQGGSGLRSSAPSAQEVHLEGDGTFEGQDGKCEGGRHGFVLARGNRLVATGGRAARFDWWSFGCAWGHA